MSHNRYTTEKYRAYHREYSRQYNEEGYGLIRRERIQKYRHIMKLKVLIHYGFKCAMCGYENIDALTVDHINDDGYLQYESGGHTLYRWLIKNNYPPGFQILCANCQMIKKKQKDREDFIMLVEAIL